MQNNSKYLIKNLFSIKKKVYLITGSEGGMGKEIVRLIRINGGVAVCIDKINLKSSKNIYYRVDLSKKSEILDFSKKIKKKYNKFDGIINLAGISDSKNFEKNFQVNIFSVYYLIKSLHTLIDQQGCSIVNITSLNSELGFSNNPGYNSSKGALKMLTKSMALDLAKYNIRVNNVGPGYIKTKMTQKSFKNKIEKNKRIKRTLLNKYGDVKDLFGIILYLISDSSSYVTGQDFYVDGGFLAKGI